MLKSNLTVLTINAFTKYRHIKYMYDPMIGNSAFGNITQRNFDMVYYSENIHCSITCLMAGHLDAHHKVIHTREN